MAPVAETTAATFIDPRTGPDPPDGRPPPRLTTDPADLEELRRLCRDGRLYEVENWIREGKPLQLDPAVRVTKRRRRTSALDIALGRGNQALTLLFLANGYAPDLEPASPLDLALKERREDFLDLLLAWGADPHRVSRVTLYETYRSEWMERFRELGIDLGGDGEMAEVLSERSSNKPLFGFAKRHRKRHPEIQRELDMALVWYAGKGHEKGVQLCLWAGADPHARVPNLDRPWTLPDPDNEDDEIPGDTAIEEAAKAGHRDILKRLDPNPDKDDFDELYKWCGNPAIVHALAPLGLPSHPSAVIRWHLLPFNMRFDRYRSVSILEALFKAGFRWTESSPKQIADVRQGLLKLSNFSLEEILKLLCRDDHVSPEILQELARTPAFRRKMTETGFMPRQNEDPVRWERRRAMRFQEVTKKCGLVKPKEKARKGGSRDGRQADSDPPLPRTVRVGRPRRGAQEVRLTRRELFDRVWSTPMMKLAAEFGLSDQGLAKLCRRLTIPRPPRGHWAKKRAGKKARRPRLPKLPEGQGEEVAIWSSGDHPVRKN